MKFAIFALVFAILIAASSFADSLKITEIDFHVDYDEAYTYRVENRDKKDFGSVNPANGSKIDADVFPGSNITFTVRIENAFKREGPEIKGVFARMTIGEIDDGGDLEEDSLNVDLEPGDDYRFDIPFTIPLEVESKTYDVVIEAEGDGRNDTLHQTILNLKLEVKKQRHDLRITKYSLSPSIVSCERDVKITAEMMNLGSNLENENALEFKSDSLGINSIDRDISLEISDEASEEEKIHAKTLNAKIPPSISPRTYPIFINLYWKNFVLFDQKKIDLIVRSCGGAIQEKETEETGSENGEQPEPQQSTAEQQQYGQQYGPGFSAQRLLSPVLIMSIAAGFAVFVIFAVIIIRKFK